LGAKAIVILPGVQGHLTLAQHRLLSEHFGESREQLPFSYVPHQKETSHSNPAKGDTQVSFEQENCGNTWKKEQKTYQSDGYNRHNNLQGKDPLVVGLKVVK
jgi:hypothetical protein